MTILGGPVVPDVKKQSAGLLGWRVPGTENVVSLGILERSLLKSSTPAGICDWLVLVLALICMMLRKEGHALRCLILRHFATATSSPTNAAAFETFNLYSMSLSTSSVVQGHRIIPLRRQAVASFHQAGMRGRITIKTSPAFSPRSWSNVAIRCDELDISA